MSYTPGPWAISRLATPDYAPEFGIYAEGSQRDLARVVGPNSEADAQLIKAAPKLLAACYAVLHDCNDIDMVESNEPGREKGPWQMLNEAIAEALGDRP